MSNSKQVNVLVLGGGCFWCTEAVFQSIRGVINVVPGYAGGHVANPKYEQVCSGTTGHAEVIQIQYEPEVVTLETLLKIFWLTHDPTTLNRQGNDVGTQYRSCVFVDNEEQEKVVVQVMTAMESHFDAPIVTTIERLTENSRFYPAEPEHHQYYQLHPNQGYCQWVISPKLQKLRSSILPLFHMS